MFDHIKSLSDILKVNIFFNHLLNKTPFSKDFSLHLPVLFAAMFVPLLGQRIGFAFTAVLGAVIIVLSLITASFIDTAAMLFIP
jgi:hypothetical protein